MRFLSYLHKQKEQLGRLQGWRRYTLAFGFGVMATLCLPPFYFIFLAIPSFCGLAWLVTSALTLRRAFFDGWWFGLGHFTTGLYWMCIALLTDPEKFAWLIPFTLIGLNGIIALYPAVFAAIVWKVKRHATPGLSFAVFFAGAWTLVEIARGLLFTGFPWNLIGYSLAFSDILIQPAALLGIYGLSFLFVLAALLPAGLLAGRKQALACLLLFIAISISVTGYGYLRLIQATSDTVPGVRLRIVQGNIAQHHKWDPALQMQGLTTYGRLSRAAGWEHVTHVIWPETAIPYALNQHDSLLNMLSTVAPPKGALLSGTLRTEGGPGDFKIWNSLAVISAEGQKVANYDKHHLVPFGEYVPFRHILPLEKITHGNTDFSSGPGVQTLSLPGAPDASPLICYESIFTGSAANREQGEAGWLLNVTNDAWFGRSTGPYQHLQMSRIRAVEEGLPLVRAANTGVSAVFDAYGRVTARLGLGRQGVIDTGLPIKIAPTMYAGKWYKLLLFISLVIVTLGLSLNSKQIFNN